MRSLCLIAALAFALAACTGHRPKPPDSVAPETEAAPVVPSAPQRALPAGQAAARPAVLPSYRSTPETRARSAEAYSGTAVRALLKQSREALDKGHNDQASAALERALRIEPKNPFVWQAMAATHLQGGRADAAESTAEKSISLAAGNAHVAAESWRLIAQARSLRGDSAGADEAMRQADEAQSAD